MSENSINDTLSETESLDEDIEPKLKYSRLLNDVQMILLKDVASCIAVHPKFVCLGSHYGVVHLLDIQGNSIQCKELKKHSVAINQISIDANGDFLATCSDDGKIYIQGLYTNDNNHCIDVGRTVKTIALDPNYYKPGSGRRFITGDDKLTLHEKSFLGRWKPTVLCESEGFVRSLCWGENFVAWSSNIGVRVYDITARCSLGLIQWEDHPGTSIEKFRCNLRWADKWTLLIGWVDTVRVCVIRKRSNIELANREKPEFLVDPISTFQTDFYISGIAPLEHQLVLLGIPKTLDENQKSMRPQLYTVEYRDNEYTDICTDYLSLRGYQEYNVNDYHLDCLVEENRFFIVAPKDVVLASPYDLDDRVQWLIQHNKYEDAIQAITQTNERNCEKFSLETVGIAYLDYLLARGEYEQAAQLCFKIFGRKKSLWEDQIYKFAPVNQLRAVSRYIPQTLEYKLESHIYEMILYEYLKMDAKGFLDLVREWNPKLYNTSPIINAILEHLVVCDLNKDTYMEALAVLYSYERKYDKSLSVYLKLRHKDVFMLIKKHALYEVIHSMIVDLMDLDCDKTIAMLLDEKNSVPCEVVVEKLQDHEMLLYKYLHAYDKKDSSGHYHGKLVRLYGIFDRDKLLPFLKRSDHYPIQEALDICQREKYYPEMVYLLGRIGDMKEALELILNELKDMQQAITFCQEHDDPDLWNDLINHSLDKPEYIKFLLQSIGTHVDPTHLVQKIQMGMNIPGLKTSLVTMLCAYNLQVSVQEGCKKILVSDYFNLHKKQVHLLQKGICISDEMVCGACHRVIIIPRDASKANSIIVYNCKHCFHEHCLPETIDITNCGICYPVKQK